MASHGAVMMYPWEQPSPELALKEWCNIQREKYGSDWKDVLVGEMSKSAAKLYEVLGDIKKRVHN